MPPWLLLLIFGGLFFLMMRAGCGSHAAGHSHRNHSRQSAGGISAPDNTIDPVCGMTVEPKRAKSVVHEGHAFYFCSAACREKFEASPETYAHARSIGNSGMEQHHG